MGCYVYHRGDDVGGEWGPCLRCGQQLDAHGYDPAEDVMLSDETRAILGPLFGLVADAIDAVMATEASNYLARSGAQTATRLLRDQGVDLLEGMGATDAIEAHVAEIKGTVTFE